MPYKQRCFQQFEKNEPVKKDYIVYIWSSIITLPIPLILLFASELNPVNLLDIFHL